MNHDETHSSEGRGLNPSRFSVENPHITWVLLIGTVIWGIYGTSTCPSARTPTFR